MIGQRRRALVRAALSASCLAAAFPVVAQTPAGRPAAPAPPPAAAVSAPPSYESLVNQAKRQLANNHPEQAQVTADRAIKLDGHRYEAHVISAAALRDQKKYTEAAVPLQIALGLALDRDKPAILRAIVEVRLAGLPADGRRKLDALMLAVDDADRAQTAGDRTKRLRGFMVQSNAFLDDYPFVAELWLLRAAASIELGYPETAWIAARKVAELGVADSDDPGVRKIMAQMEQRQWLGQTVPAKNGDEVAGIRVDWNYLKDHPQQVCLEGPPPRGPGYYCDALRSLALTGDAYWEAVLGDVFNGGVYPRDWHTSDDRSVAIQWYRQAADQGFGYAAARLSQLVIDGSERRKWALKGASLGLAEGQQYLGRLYQSGLKGAAGGTSMPPDSAEAIRWLKKAAAQKYVLADLDLARTFREGIGVSADSLEAIRWYHLAAQHAADSLSRNNVAWYLATDPDVIYRDGTVALRLAKEACDATNNMTDIYVDTLAAAYAETGDWDDAVSTQQLAITLLQNNKERTAEYLAGFQARLQLYRSRKPYREPPPTPR